MVKHWPNMRQAPHPHILYPPSQPFQVYRYLSADRSYGNPRPQGTQHGPCSGPSWRVCAPFLTPHQEVNPYAPIPCTLWHSRGL